jgi:hypothetical protein
MIDIDHVVVVRLINESIPFVAPAFVKQVIYMNINA